MDWSDSGFLHGHQPQEEGASKCAEQPALSLLPCSKGTIPGWVRFIAARKDGNKLSGHSKIHWAEDRRVWHVVTLEEGLLDGICVEATRCISAVGEKLCDSFHSTSALPLEYGRATDDNW